MADPGGVDEVGIMHRVDIFMHAHGHKRLENRHHSIPLENQCGGFDDGINGKE
jgi:hypothetical protein